MEADEVGSDPGMEWCMAGVDFPMGVEVEVEPDFGPQPLLPVPELLVIGFGCQEDIGYPVRLFQNLSFVMTLENCPC